MKLVFVVIFVLISGTSCAKGSVEEILDSLDHAINQRDFYNNQREKRIASQKELLAETNNEFAKLYMSIKLAVQYLPYNSDSALLYSSKSVEMALKNKNQSDIIDAKLILSLAYTQTGMYGESEQLLDSLDKSLFNREQKSKYYIARINLNRYKNISLPKASLQPDFGKLRAMYQDSLLSVIDTSLPEYAVAKADRYFDVGDYKKTRDVMIASLNNLTLHDRAYGYTSYTLASAYDKLSDPENQLKYLALSAISDILCGQRENSSLRELSLLLYKKGDLDRAYKYIKVALDDAIFSNAKLRSFEVLQILPLIEQEYTNMRNQMNRNKTYFGWALSVFVLILLVTLWFIWRQKARLNAVLVENRKINSELFDINEQLKKSNESVLVSNIKLEVLNRHQENYIAHYLKLSSSYIGKLDDYRRMLYKMAQEDPKEQLIRKLRSKDLIDKELKEFYHDFDKSFLELYPNFVHNFNLLLKEEHRIELKPDELLNSELRIFALIRLGITNSNQIAEFLRYSVTTIYNYRTKMRNCSIIPRDKFKLEVMKIKN